MLVISRLREYIRSSLWAIPAACVITAVVASGLLVNLDHSIPQTKNAWYLFGGSAEAAKTLLATISASMLTFTALVFSITIVVLQLASGQFSPRVQRTFLRDRVSKLTLGVFIATFTYALLLLRTVRLRVDSAIEFVPAVSVTVAMGLVMLSIGFFVRYIDHIAQSIRAGSIIRSVAKESVAALEKLYPHALGIQADEKRSVPGRPADHTIGSHRAGVVTGVDPDHLFSFASKHSLTVEIQPYVGDFVPEGGPLARVWGVAPENLEKVVNQSVLIAHERTMNQDLGYGIRQLVDIAERALSPGINDPTTAVQVIDALHDLLRRLVQRSLPSTVRTDDDGDALVIAPAPNCEQYLSLALDEIRIYGEGSIQVHRRLRGLLADLLNVAPEERKQVIEHQLRRLDSAAARGFDDDEEDRANSRKTSGQGNL